MKTIMSYVACCVIFVSLASCSIIETSENYDTSYDFTKLKKYDWAQVENKKPAHALLMKQLRGELKNQLAEKAYRYDAQDPDFLIALHGGTENKVRIYRADYGYRYGYRYGAWYDPGRVDVYEYKEGTLILHVIDAKSKELVFESITTAEITRNMSMEKRQKYIKKVITKAIKSFPP